MSKAEMLPTLDEEASVAPQKNYVYRIVLTGGPCAGKTTALVRLSGMPYFYVDPMI